MLEPQRGIYQIGPADRVDNPDMKEIDDGWYFADETEQLDGPYPSQQAAVDAREALAAYLNQPTGLCVCKHVRSEHIDTPAHSGQLSDCQRCNCVYFRLS